MMLQYLNAIFATLHIQTKSWAVFREKIILNSKDVVVNPFFIASRRLEMFEKGKGREMAEGNEGNDELAPHKLGLLPSKAPYCWG